MCPFVLDSEFHSEFHQDPNPIDSSRASHQSSSQSSDQASDQDQDPDPSDPSALDIVTQLRYLFGSPQLVHIPLQLVAELNETCPALLRARDPLDSRDPAAQFARRSVAEICDRVYSALCSSGAFSADELRGDSEFVACVLDFMSY